MNKNPFLPAPSYTPQQPPLPPGPPPPQPAQADYSAWYGAAPQPHAQPPTVGPYNPQWAPPQAPRPPAEQSALYANYGYGSQNSHWQRQQQQQQQQQYHPPPQVIHQPPPPPPTQPGYNPYQPAAGYPQPYIPQPAPIPPVIQPAYPHPPSQPQHVFAPPMGPQQPQHQHHQQPTQPRNHHTSPQHLPPAKRQRFDGPNTNNRQHHQGQQHHQQPPPPQFQPPPPPPQHPSSFSGPNRGPIPSGPGNRSGAPPNGPGGRGGSVGARGGRGGSAGSTNRGGLSGGRGRGGGSFMGGGGPGRGGAGGGQSAGPLRGHGSRSNFGGGNKDFHNRRGGGPGGSFNSGGGGSGGGGGNYTHQGSFRGRNQGPTGPARGNRNDSGSGNAFGAREGTATSSFGGKKDENRRTLTDFKIIGLAISDLGWTWGSIPSVPVKAEDGEHAKAGVGVSEITIKDEVVESDDVSVKEEGQLDGKLGSGQGSQLNDVDMDNKNSQELSRARVASDANTPSSPPPPSRIRIYFHTPVTADDSRPIPHNSSYGDAPSDSRKGKRKKLEDDDGDLEERRAPPPPPQMGNSMIDDRASTAPSVAETVSEADWLMAAIVEGEEEAEAAGELDLAEEDDDDQLHVSEIVKEEHVDPADNVNDGESRGEDDAFLGGKQDHTVRDLALSVKVPPLDRLTRGGMSLRAHTADMLVFIQGAPHDVLVSSMKSDEGEDALTELGTVDHDSSLMFGDGPSSGADDHSVPEVPLAGVEAPQPTSEEHAGLESSDDPSSQNENFAPDFVADHPADHPENSDSQVYPESSQPYPTKPKSLLSTSMEPTLLDIETHPTTQADDSQTTQIFSTDHLPEPPVSPYEEISSFTSAKADSKGEKTPSANRLSISYARGIRRLVVDAEVVENLQLYRQEGRIEVTLKLIKEKDNGLKGILVEGLSDVTKSYLTLPASSDTSSDSDHTVPPFGKLDFPSTIRLIVYLDTARPLSEPKWAKTGDIQDWLKSMFGRMFWVAGEAAEGWEKKIHVVDPDPPPTIWTVLDGWATNSPVGALNERQRFLKTHMTEIDNILEILLRLVRGERATAFSQTTPTISAPSVSGPLLSALTQSSAHGSQQTHVSLAVLAMFRLTVEYAEKAQGEKGKADAEGHIGEIIRCLPSHLLYKSLDGIFKEWRVEKKGR